MILTDTRPLADQWACAGLLQPELVAALEDFGRWSVERMFPRAVITSLIRPPRERFSWHFARCAADIRSRHYDPDQLRLVLEWWAGKFPRPGHEVLLHDAGSGLHLHLAVRDQAWRTGVVQPEEAGHG